MTIIILVPSRNQRQPLIAFHIFISSWDFMSHNATVNTRMCFSYEFLFMAMQFSGLVRNLKGWKWSFVDPNFSVGFPLSIRLFLPGSFWFTAKIKEHGQRFHISFASRVPPLPHSLSPTLNVSCLQLILLLFLSLLVKLNLCLFHVYCCVYFLLSFSFVDGSSIILMI